MSPAQQTPDEHHDQSVTKVARIIAATKVCMLTTTDAGGRLTSRPMAVQTVPFDGDLWFFSDADARKIEQVRRTARVNVALGSGDSWVSVTGDAEVVHDAGKARALWNAAVSAWFPDGPESPGLALVKVTADSAEYWDTPGLGVASLLSFAKARTTGRRYSGGENESVEL